MREVGEGCAAGRPAVEVLCTEAEGHSASLGSFSFSGSAAVDMIFFPFFLLG